MEDDNDDIKKIFSVYESNYDNFRKVFAISIGFGLFFLLTVVLPYFLNIYEYSQNEILYIKENKSIEQESINIRNLNAHIDKIQDQIEFTSDRINNTRSSIDIHIKQVNNLLSDADRLLGDINDPSALKRLKGMLNQTKYKQNTTIQLATVVLRSLNNSVSDYEHSIQTLNQSFHNSEVKIAISQSNLDKARMNRMALNERLINLTERWKEIQSPFGSLPIDFTNLLAILPLALSGGFHLCSLWLAESIRLRMVVDDMRDTEKENEGHHKKGKIYLIAPLWIDPANPNQNKIVQLLLLAIPLIIFALSVIMISYAWEHAPTDPFPTASQINKNIYYTLYVVCVGDFGYSFWRILKEIKYYIEFICSKFK